MLCSAFICKLWLLWWHLPLPGPGWCPLKQRIQKHPLLKEFLVHWSDVHWLITINVLYQRKHRDKNWRESGQIIKISKRCISDPYHEIEMLISVFVHLTACYRKELIGSHPERLSIWGDCYVLFLSSSSFCPLNIALIAV